MWCKYDNGGYGYWGTEGSAWLECPDGMARTGDYRYCGEIREPDDCSNGASPRVGNPIDVASGAKIETETDFSAAAGRLHFTRTYTSLGIAETPLGQNWSSNFHPTLIARRAQWYSGTFVLVLPSGEVVRFQKGYNDWGAWLAPSNPWHSGWVTKESKDRRDREFTLTELDVNTLILGYPDGKEQEFHVTASAGDAALMEERYPDGYTLSFSYNGNNELQSVTDSFGNSVLFTYHGNGYLESVTDPDGNVYRYSHHIEMMYPYVIGTANLEHVIYPDETPGDLDDNPKKQYIYDDLNESRALTGIVDELGKRVRTWAYSDFRAISSEGPAGLLQTTLQEDLANDRVTVTNALGKETIYHFTEYRGLKKLAEVEGAPSQSCAASTSTQTYNSSGQVIGRVGAEGQTMTISPNTTTGLPNSVTYGAGTPEAATVTYSWDTTIRKPLEINREGLRENYVYDGNANPTSLTLTDTTSHSVPYSTNGSTRTWTYSWLANGLLSSVDGPLAGAGDTVSFTYDSSGNLASVTNENGLTTTINSSNGNGQPLQITDPNGLQTEISYTPRGWVSSVSIGTKTTSFDYDDAGNLIQTGFPSGASITYSYNDAGWITSASTSSGETVQYTHDNMGNVLSQTISAGASSFSQTYSYDELGRLTSILGGAGDTTQFSYDRSDRLTGTQDGVGRSWLTGFDALNRVITSTDPESDVVATAWDETGDLVSFTDANIYQTSYVRNGFGEAIRESSPDTGTTDYWYDAAGRVTGIVDAAGHEVMYTYDDGGRVVSETYPAQSSLNASYSYDSVSAGNAGLGRLTGVDGSHVDQSFVYNIDGQLIAESTVIGSQAYPAAYSYNAAGDLEVLTLPSGRQVQFANDGFGRITAITARPDSSSSYSTVVSSVSRAPHGPVTSYTFGNGASATFSYDQSYRLTRIAVSGGAQTLLDKTYTYNATGRVSDIDDAITASADAAFDYHDDGRLESAIGLWGDLDWTYDPVGNRTSETESLTGGFSVTRTYTYASSSNRLQSVLGGGGTPLRAFSYKINGAMSADARMGDGSYEYAYDEAGRLASVTKNSVQLVSYKYDAFEHRAIRATSSGELRHFIFDGSGHLLGEYDGDTGAVMREYVWLDGQLVASFDGAGDVTYVQTGHLGQPLLLMDAAAAVVLQGEVTPWGDVIQISGTGDPADLRLPGQWAEEGSGLSHNWHRDYDPTIGRYIQADPLGIAAGQSVYGYAGQDPLNAVDPDGRWIIPAFRTAYSAGRAVGTGIRAYRAYRAAKAARDAAIVTAGALELTDIYDDRDFGICKPIITPRPVPFTPTVLPFDDKDIGHPPSNPDDDPDCKKEWEEAYQACSQIIGDPSARNRSGGYTNLHDCAKGLVSYRCGGNPPW